MIPKLGLGAFLLVVALAPLLGGSPAGEKYHADTLLLLVRALVLVGGVCVMSSSSGARPPRLAVWAFAAWTTLSLLIHSRALTSPVLLFAMLPATLDAVCFATVFTLAQSVGGDTTKRQQVFGALAVGLGLTALLVLREFGATHTRAQGLLPISDSLVIGFFSPNFAAGFLGLCLPLSAALCLLAKERLPALLYGVVTALGLGALAATGSRVGAAAGALGLVVALGLGAISQRGKLPWPRLLALLGASAVLLFGCREPLLKRAETVPGKSQPSSGSGAVDAFRRATWQGTASMAQKNALFGTGPGTFPYLYPRYARVAQTDLAHQSYLQTASESGVPAALFGVAAVLLALAIGLKNSLASRDLTAAALVGGLCVALIRSLFDSEWSLLGDALPLFTIAGLATVLPRENTTEAAQQKRFPLLALVCGVGLLFTVLMQTGVWPVQPGPLARLGKLELAAEIEPTARWFFPLGRQAERQSDYRQAVSWFERALAADPNSLQTLRALAESQEKAGDSAASLATWRRLLEVNDGPVGQIRALPETTETYPAFAYAALARSGETALWERCAAVIEAYADTPPDYQKNEFSLASAATVQARRAEVRALYEEAIKNGPPALAARRDDTLKKLDAFVSL